jgi:hypothetical protein
MWEKETKKETVSLLSPVSLFAECLRFLGAMPSYDTRP